MDHEYKDTQHDNTAVIELDGTLSGDMLEEDCLTDPAVLGLRTMGHGTAQSASGGGYN